MEASDRLDIPATQASLAQAGDGNKDATQRDPVFVLLDDLAADSDDEAAAVEEFLRRRAVSTELAEACLKAVLSRTLQRRLIRGGTAIVIAVPGADWVTPLAAAAERLFRQADIVSRDGSRKSEHKPDKGGAEVAHALSIGRSVVGVSHAPARFLPSALLTVADAHVDVKAPGGAALKKLVRRLTGRRVRGDIKNDIAGGLSFDEIAAAFRAGAGPARVLGNLAASSSAKSRVSATDDTPPLAELPGYDGEPRTWATRLAEDIGAWRDGKIPWRGVSASAVLYGPPGTGKTLFAKGLARQLRIPIVVTSCGEWFQSGEGNLGDVIQAAQRAFDAARAAAPCVLFIDELDGIPDRQTLTPRGRDWWQPVVNFVLTLVDGAVTARDGVVLVGATNHPDKLDRALVRAGRFDRMIALPPPSPTVLAQVMRLHLRGALADVDLEPVARLAAPGSTPADAAAWVRDAVAAARAAGRAVSVDDIVRVIAPPDNRPADLLRVIAIHEAGHAVGFGAIGARISALSMISQGIVAGGARVEKIGDRILTRPDIDGEVVGLLCGRAAEEVIVGVVSAGAVADLAEATQKLAIAQASQGLGASLLHWGDPSQALIYDRDLRDLVEADLRRLYARACALIRRRRAAVERIADALLAHRFLAGDAVDALLAPRRRTDCPTIHGRNP